MRNSEIVVIPNQYKSTPDDFINGSDPESLDQAGSIDERSRNTSMSKSSLADLSKGDYMNKDLPDGSLQLAPKTRDSQMHQCHIIAP